MGSASRAEYAAWLLYIGITLSSSGPGGPGRGSILGRGLTSPGRGDGCLLSDTEALEDGVEEGLGSGGTGHFAEGLESEADLAGDDLEGGEAAGALGAGEGFRGTPEGIGVTFGDEGDGGGSTTTLQAGEHLGAKPLDTFTG